MKQATAIHNAALSSSSSPVEKSMSPSDYGSSRSQGGTTKEY
jgi:hypothetical protein